MIFLELQLEGNNKLKMKVIQKMFKIIQLQRYSGRKREKHKIP